MTMSIQRCKILYDENGIFIAVIIYYLIIHLCFIFTHVLLFNILYLNIILNTIYCVFYSKQKHLPYKQVLLILS